MAPPPAATAAATTPFQLMVKDSKGRVLEVSFKKSTQRLRKLISACCLRLDLQESQVRFMVGRYCIAPDDTAEKLGLKDGDTIDVVSFLGPMSS
eukprot:5868437-Heterocapsa_arctica.AAC.1